MKKRPYIMPETDIVEMKSEAMLAGVSGGKTDPNDDGMDILAKPIDIEIGEEFDDEDRNSTIF
ncbi:hypothetical protein [Prevotella rectalis]|uniref:hypothetical protein n=1 Tax=Prevotella rectalis TaxID=2219999 RepID=UPI00102F9E0B|nr:hypothetical protein [Prevotella brunnea]